MERCFETVDVLNSTQLPPRVLNLLIQGRNTPLVFQGQIESWMTIRSWKAKDICSDLDKNPGSEQAQRTPFKICPKRGTSGYITRFGGEKEVVYETQCDHIEATFSNFRDWLECSNTELIGTPPQEMKPEDVIEKETHPAKKRVKLDSVGTSSQVNSDTDHQDDDDAVITGVRKMPSNTTSTNPLFRYSNSDYWIYADYKYMCHICKDKPDILSAVDWSIFGFEGRDGIDSTLWVGSEGAYTLCHYDTYGINLVAQLSGEKRWLLFSPKDSQKMYPTRIPYEESSVFSGVNVTNPDLDKCPLFKDAVPHEVILKAGDVLYVPRHWWHYVESIGTTPTVSINTWIEQPEDAHEKVKEAIVRTLVSAFSQPQQQDTGRLDPEWINPGEEVLSNEDNLELLFQTVRQRRLQLHGEEDNEGDEHSSRLEEGIQPPRYLQHSKTQTPDFLKAVTSSRVIANIAEELLQN